MAAELLGLVSGAAGLASLAIQLGESAQKMKELYHNFKDAPRFLEDISFELETFALMLHAVERDRQSHNLVDGEIVERCVQMCRRACEEIKDSVATLEASIARAARRGKLRAAFEHSAMLQRRNELDRARQSLAFAHQLYSEACRRKTAELLMEKLGNVFDPGSSSRLQIRRGDSNSEQYCHRTHVRLARHCTNASTGTDPACKPPARAASGTQRFILQPWFVAKVWEVTVRFSLNDFGINFKTSNIVPGDSPIFEYCRIGNIAKVKYLFDAQLASPYDCAYQPRGSIHGSTVLEAAVESGNLELCKYLVKHAGFPVYPDYRQDALDAFPTSMMDKHRNYHRTHAFELYNLLLQDSRFITENFVESFEKKCQRCPSSTFLQLMKSQYQYEFASATFQARFELAMRTAWWWNPLLPAFFEILDQSMVNADVAQARDRYGRTALHMVAEQSFFLRSVDFNATWIEFLRDLLQHGADLHQIDAQGHTPLLTVMDSAGWPQDAVMCWIRLLELAGVDLEAYGDREMVKWQDICRSGKNLGQMTVKLMDWKFGPKSEDWILVLSDIVTVPLYELDCADQMAGTWPVSKSPLVTSLCWKPQKEDELERAWRWRLVRDITVRSEQFEEKDPEQFEDEDRNRVPFLHAWKSAILLTSLDDSGADLLSETRKFTRTTPPPRSHSQPRGWLDDIRLGESHGSVHRWHRCCYDGRRRKGYGFNERECAKNIHTSEEQYMIHRISDNLRRFRYRFHSRDELRALPYSAYGAHWTITA